MHKCCVWKKAFVINSEGAEIVYELESGGHKLTKLRRVLIDIFSRRQHPLLLEELGRLLHDHNLDVHRTTLYRELTFLESKKIVVPVALDGKKIRYEFADRGHHHHAICTKCKKIEDIELEDDDEPLQKLIKSKKNFEITRHHLEFFGVCGACQNV